MAADPTPQLADLQHIRQLMDRTTRFLSLSGLSGIAVGFIALFAAMWALDFLMVYEQLPNPTEADFHLLLQKLVLLAMTTLAAALLAAWYFTWRLVRRRGGRQVLTRASLRMMIALGMPLFAGGMFCLILMWHGSYGLIAPAMLLFYGLGISASAEFTLPELRWLGYLELALGLAAAVWLGYGLLFWALGFGVLHIIYGAWMYWKYERNPAATHAS